MYSFFNSTAFLSGCIPIALINFIVNYSDEDLFVVWFSVFFLLVSILAGLYFRNKLKSFFQYDNETAIVSNIKRKDIFASGAISYYVLPFISFVTGGRNGVIILIILTCLLMWIFNNNRMFLYTPLIDLLGYQIFECDIKFEDQIIKATIITPNGNKMYFTGYNDVRIYKIEADIYAAELIE